jgi:hypothetical protein
MENPTTEEIAQHYKAMGDSVWLINAVMAGNQMAAASDADKKACVDRNIRHLELMLLKDFWTTEDMTSVKAAIALSKK